MCYAITATTRPQRVEERNGVDYWFLSGAEFQEKIKQGQFLEYAQVYGRWYGVPKQLVKEALTRGQDVVIKVDVQGAATIKKVVPDAILIFLAPPSLEELEQRLQRRKSESSDDLRLRIEKAREEMKALHLFDYVVVNYQDKLEMAVSQIEAIITAEKCRVKPRSPSLEGRRVELP